MGDLSHVELDKAEKDLETLRVRNYKELLLDRDKWNVCNAALGTWVNMVSKAVKNKVSRMYTLISK